MAARTGVLPPPPPQKRVPCASSPQWIDCPVEGAKAKSAGKGVPASLTSIQSFEEPKAMQREVEMYSVNEHNFGSGRLPVMFNPPPPPKKETHTVAHSSWISRSHDFEEQTISSSSSVLPKPPSPPRKNASRLPTPPRVCRKSQTVDSALSTTPCSVFQLGASHDWIGGCSRRYPSQAKK